MASVAKHVRVKVTVAQFQKSWLLVDFEQSKVISDLEDLIKKRYQLPSSIQLFIDDCMLLSADSTQILRDGDIISVVAVGKKRKSTHTHETILPPAITDNKEQKSNEISVSGGHTAKHKLAKFTKGDERSDISVEQTSSEIKLPYSNNSTSAQNQTNRNVCVADKVVQLNNTRKRRRRKRGNKQNSTVINKQQPATSRVVQQDIVSVNGNASTQSTAHRVSATAPKRNDLIESGSSSSSSESSSSAEHVDVSKQISNDARADIGKSSHVETTINKPTEVTAAKETGPRTSTSATTTAKINSIQSTSSSSSASSSSESSSESEEEAESVQHSVTQPSGTPATRVSGIATPPQPQSTANSGSTKKTVAGVTTACVAPPVTPTITDYSKYPMLFAAPTRGARIAFKILALSGSYTPEVSQYTEATVVSYDGVTHELYLKIKGPLVLGPRSGKLLIDEHGDGGARAADGVVPNQGKDGGGEDGDNVVIIQNEIRKMQWTDLIEPKLISLC